MCDRDKLNAKPSKSKPLKRSYCHIVILSHCHAAQLPQNQWNGLKWSVLASLGGAFTGRWCRFRRFSMRILQLHESHPKGPKTWRKTSPEACHQPNKNMESGVFSAGNSGKLRRQRASSLMLDVFKIFKRKVQGLCYIHLFLAPWSHKFTSKRLGKNFPQNLEVSRKYESTSPQKHRPPGSLWLLHLLPRNEANQRFCKPSQQMW